MRQVAVEVVLYEGAGCGLCARAPALLEDAAPRLGFRLRRVAIDGDDELERRYRIDLPVVLVDGETRVHAGGRRGAAAACRRARTSSPARKTVRDTAFPLLTRRCATVCY